MNIGLGIWLGSLCIVGVALLWIGFAAVVYRPKDGER